MPYLTKLSLDPKALRESDIRDDYSIHKLVYSCFPLSAGEKPARPLYADLGAAVPGRRTLLILSEREPEPPEYVASSATVVSEAFLGFPEYRFEVDLNPTRRDRTDGKRRAVTGQLDLLQWFIAHAPKWGFEADSRFLEVFSRPTRRFDKAESKCIFNHAFYRGRLRVTDRQLFRRSFFAGLGHGKAFGFGLLRLVPCRSAADAATDNQQ